MKTPREQAIEYRRQLLRIVDQIERDYKLGKYTDVKPCGCGKCVPETPETKAVVISGKPDSDGFYLDGKIECVTSGANGKIPHRVYIVDTST